MLSVYSGATVLVTGHTGFKGSWLTTWLSLLGAKVVGISNGIPSTPCLFEAAGIASLLTHITADIRDQYALNAAFAEHQPDFVFHLAAQPLVRLSYEDPIETYEVNVIGTLRVLDAARRCPSVRAIVNVTSDKCYENKEWIWGYRETDPMGGYDPYSSSKGCAELAAQSFRRSYLQDISALGRPVGLACARAGNVIGGGDWGLDRIVPDCIRAFSRNGVVVLRRPESVRPWQHVLEPLSGYLQLGALLFEDPARWGGGWNFGPLDHKVVTVGELVHRLAQLWDDSHWVVESTEQQHEANWLKLDISKSMIEMQWKPRLALDVALDMTTMWYKQFYSGASAENLLNLTCKQIQAYVNTK